MVSWASLMELETTVLAQGAGSVLPLGLGELKPGGDSNLQRASPTPQGLTAKTKPHQHLSTPLHGSWPRAEPLGCSGGHPGPQVCRSPWCIAGGEGSFRTYGYTLILLLSPHAGLFISLTVLFSSQVLLCSVFCFFAETYCFFDEAFFLSFYFFQAFL